MFVCDADDIAGHLRIEPLDVYQSTVATGPVERLAILDDIGAPIPYLDSVARFDVISHCFPLNRQKESPAPTRYGAYHILPQQCVCGTELGFSLSILPYPVITVQAVNINIFAISI